MYKFIFVALSLILFGCSSTPPSDSPTEAFQDYLNAGKFHLEHQQFTQAEKYFNLSLSESQTVDNLYGQAVSFLSLTQVMQNTGNDKLAVLYFNQASEIIPMISKEQPGVSKYYLNLLYGQYYEILADFNMQQGDKAKALENLKLSEKYYSKSLQ